MSQRWPCLERFSAKAVVSRKRIIDRIILRCLRSETYHTILDLRKTLRGENKMATNPRNEMVWNAYLDPPVALTRLDLMNLPLRGFGLAVTCRGRSHRDESQKASL